MTMGMCTTILPPPPDFNGHDYVDLGLPSGTLWATMNVGASKPSNAGLYFQWGDTVGYTADQVGKDKQFAPDYSDYKWVSGWKLTKYTTNGAKLELEDDAAHVHMGGDWHMPTPAQIQELLNNTISTWTTLDNGVSGMTFTSKKDTSKSIFFPAAGNTWRNSFYDVGGYGRIWTSVLSTNTIRYGQYLYFNNGNITLGDYVASRIGGRSVRGVIG